MTDKAKPKAQAKAPAKPRAPRVKAEPKPKLPVGRPTLWDETIAADLLDRMSGGETLVSICKTEGYPATRTVSDWKASRPEFAADFARAREDGFDAIAAEILEIADCSDRDWEPVCDDKGAIIGIKVDGEHVTRSKLRIEARFKLLAKWDPKRYGEMIKLNHGDADGKALPPMDDLAVATRLSALLEVARERRDGGDEE